MLIVNQMCIPHHLLLNNEWFYIYSLSVKMTERYKYIQYLKNIVNNRH